MVEARFGAVRRTATPGSGQRPGRANGRECSWSVAAGAVPCAGHRTAQCLFRLARDSEIDWRFLAHSAEPPYTDPYVRWCDRESWRQPTYVYYAAPRRFREGR